MEVSIRRLSGLLRWPKLSTVFTEGLPQRRKGAKKKSEVFLCAFAPLREKLWQSNEQPKTTSHSYDSRHRRRRLDLRARVGACAPSLRCRNFARHHGSSLNSRST